MDDPFKNLGMVVNGLLFLSPREALGASENGALFVDTREEYENGYKSFDVSEVIYIPWHEFENRLAGLPEERYLVIADSAGNKIRQALTLLKEKGYSRVAGLNGGIFDWERDGLPMKFRKGESLTGSCTCMLKPKKKFRSWNG